MDTATQTPPAANLEAAAPPPPPPPPSPPVEVATPAAAAVAAARITEQTASLADELAKEKASHATTAAAIKARETRIAELEDELHRLKQATKPAAKPAAPRDRWLLLG